MGAADEVRALAEDAESRRRAEQERLAERARRRLEQQTEEALAGDVPVIVDSILRRAREAAKNGGRRIEWKWDTQYPDKDEYGPPNKSVAMAVEDEVRRRLEAEGFRTKPTTRGDRHSPIRDEGYTGGDYLGSYGYVEVSW